MQRLLIDGLEAAVRLANRRGRQPAAPRAHFGPGGLPEAREQCAAANRDLLAFVRPPARVPARNLSVRPLGTGRRFRASTLSYDSPLPTGGGPNDRVHARLYEPPVAPRDPANVVVFHPAARQDTWGLWEWFVADLVRRTPVVVLAPPHHFERRRPGECGGERSFCANPWRLFEALRQWAWDQAALTTALREVIGLSPSATIGFSLGGFQTLLLASAGALDGPLVTIAATNRYAHGVLRGVVGADVLQQSKRAGIYPLALYHMTRSVQLDRYVHRLRGRDVLYIDGLYDEVDPPPSLERLRLALAPSRTLRLPAGHATLLLWRRRIAAETASFLTAVGALPADVRRARRWLRLPRPAR